MESEAQRKARLKATKAKFAELAAADEATRIAGMTLKGAAQGLGAFPDLFSAIGNLGLSLSGREPNIPYASEKIKQGFNYLTNNQFEPQTTGEKMAERAIEFASGGGATNLAVKGLAKGGVNLGNRLSRFLTTKGAREYGAAAGAGAGLEYGKEEMPESPLAQLLYSLGGAALGGKGVGLSKSITSPKQALAESLAINPKKVQAFQEAKLTPTLSNISDSRIVGMGENILKNTPFSAEPFDESIKRTQEQIAKYGEGLTRQQGGELAQKALKDWRIKGAETASKLQQRVDSHISSYTPVKLTNTLEIIGDKPKAYTNVAKGIFEQSGTGKKFSEIEEALNQVKKNAEQNLNKGFDLDGNAIGNQQINNQMNNITSAIEALKSGTILPYSDAVILRKSIDSIIDGRYGSAYGETFDISLLKKLRANLQKDISNTLEGISPQAAKDNARFNTFYHNYANKRDKIIAPLLENKTATETFNKIVNDTNVDAGALKALKSTLKPDQKQLFTESLIKELGSTPQNEFNSSTLATRFKKLDPEAQEIALSGLSPEYQKKFRATIDAIDAIKNTMQTGNTSRTAYTSSLIATGAGIVTNPIKTAVTLAAARGTAELFTNPKFLNWISKASNIKDPKKLEQSLGYLDKLAKETPQIAPDILQYKDNLDKLQNDEEFKNDMLEWDEEEFEKLNAKYNTNNPIIDSEGESTPKKANEGMEINPTDQEEWNQEEWERLNAKFGNNQAGKVDEDLINKISQIESGGNPNAKAKTSTASGLLQFTDSTWKDGVKRYGDELGITFKDKADPEAQKAIAARMLEDNAQELKTFLNREPTQEEIYLTHFLGLKGAKKLLKSDPSQIAATLFPEAAKANRTIFFNKKKPITNGQLLALIRQKVESA